MRNLLGAAAMTLAAMGSLMAVPQMGGQLGCRFPVTRRNHYSWKWRTRLACSRG